MIEVQDLSKVYGGKVPTPALKGVSFEIARGELVAVMGRSGSGKSTLLHQLGLLDSPTGGRILIDGTDVSSLPDSVRTRFRLQYLGYVFQEYALVNDLTALENVFLPAFALGSARDDSRTRATDALQTVGLGHRLHHYPNELSGGEQQRVAIARALINRPKILFADEPTANLDSISAKIVLDLFRGLNREQGLTTMMVTHENEDSVFVDRVIWLKDGSVERIDESPSAK